MISKGILRITDEEKKYGRTYEASFGYDVYVKSRLQDIFPDCAEKDLLGTVLDSFVIKNGKASKRALNEIQKYIDERTKN